MAKEIWITAQDRQRLKGVLASLTLRTDPHIPPHLSVLDAELNRATIILAPNETPPDVVTMCSVVRLRNLSTGSVAEYTVSYPQDGPPRANQLSVLDPLGTAVLGCQCGDEITVSLPEGETLFLVEELCYQPEAAGDHDL